MSNIYIDGQPVLTDLFAGANIIITNNGNGSIIVSSTGATFNNGISISGNIIYNGTGNATIIPNNTTTVASWVPMIVTGIQFYMPLYQ